MLFLRPYTAAFVSVLAAVFVGAAPGLSGGGATSHAPVPARPGTTPAAVVPGRLIVRYAASVMPERGPVGGTGALPRSPSFDRLHAELGVTAARPLFAEPTPAGIRATGIRDRLAAARRSYAARTARAPRGVAVPDLANIYVLDIDPSLDVEEAARRYAANPSVVYASPDYVVHATLTPNDPFFSSTGTWGQSYEDLWGLRRTGAATAWDTARGANTVIAVVDTGVDLTHPDMQANLWTNAGEVPGNGIDDDGNGFIDDLAGWDFFADDNDPTDENGHGTHVAGTAAAVGGNALGVLGIAWEARVMPLRFLSSAGVGSTSDAARAVAYAAANGADVINMSFGAFGVSHALADALAAARALGVVAIAAAGNDNVDLRIAGFPATMHSPAGLPGVITVAASTPEDAVASFSNFGRDVSVSAPGVDVLSLKAENSGPVQGAPVGAQFLRLSGTSMAAPHVSGLAALLLSALPASTVNEVTWRIELSALQLGAPGWEGKPWNPFHGWGRISAAGLFAPLPLTTRFSAFLPPTHVFPNEVLGQPPLPVRAEPAHLVLTTTQPASWTAVTPSWLHVSPAAGTSGGPVSLTIDSTGLSPGSYRSNLVFDVPGAADGGTAYPVSLDVHRDERAGPEIILAQESVDPYRMDSPRVASNGLGTVVVWNQSLPDTSPRQIRALHIDAAGRASPPYILASGGHRKLPLVASDGSGYLVAWVEDLCKEGRPPECLRPTRAGLFMLRLDAGGQSLDSAPILLEETSQRNAPLIRDIGFDGEAYTVLTSRAGRTRVKFIVWRVGRDGTLVSRKRRIGTYKGGALLARLGCTTGSCLIAWSDLAGTSGRFFTFQVKSVQIRGDRAVNRTPRPGPQNFFIPMNLVSDGSSYLFLGSQFLPCGAPGAETICRNDAIYARLGADGSPIDSVSTPLAFNSPLNTLDIQPERFPGRGTVMFDGTNYLVPFLYEAWGSFDAPSQILLARIRPDGTRVDSETEGLLVRSTWRTIRGLPRLAVDATRSHVIFLEQNFATGESWIRDVPMLAHSPDPAFTPTTIGQIGDLQTQEGNTLRLALVAPGLDTAGTVFSATGLPRGAYLDVPTGLFLWRPDGAQAGTYQITFQASDAAANVSETVAITVAETQPSIHGHVTFQADGSAAAGVGIQLVGAGQRLATYSSADGSYRFTNLPPDRRYRMRLDRLSARRFQTSPRSLRIDLGTSDVAQDLVVTAR